MKSKLLVVLVTFCFTTLCSLTAVAQDHTRNWDNGAVVAVTEVHIKPGMFNAYINDLNGLWRKFNEEQMKDGSILGYRMFTNTSPREGEPDLILSVTYANWAAFDLGEEYFNKIRDKVIGSADEMRSAGIKRGELRTIGSQYNLQEVKFRD
jgi:hypothetical protein